MHTLELRPVKGHYAEKDLNKVYIGNTGRYDLVYKYYRKYRSRRALAFCASRQHAEDMAREFCRRGTKAVAVYSNAGGTFAESRDKDIERLVKEEIRVIFSVDMFNKGVDIASLDMVMFLRPTESPIVFLQQLGRGLRTSRGKQYLNVLDFIGNYEKAGRTHLLLGGGTGISGNRPGDGGDNGASGNQPCDGGDAEYPDDCIVDYDMRLIELFAEMEKKQLSVRERIRRSCTVFMTTGR